MSAPAAVIQTVYAELLERCAAAAFREAFPEKGTFVCKTVKGRRYWYFQEPSSQGKAQKYVGPETPELLERIERHKEIRDDEAGRRALVSTLLRSFNSPRPTSETGDVLAALAKAGAFRLRAVLVGTVAFQTYAPMLGVVPAGAALRTEDIDIAQFRDVSVAVADSIPAIMDVLKSVDETFHPVPHQIDGRKVTCYQSKRELRVEFLTPLKGAYDGKPPILPALGTNAEPLPFLDFLISEPEPAVVLHDAGIYVNVPAPQRYALHKLIVSQRRRAGSPKRDKDLRQTEALLDVLVEKRPFELHDAWDEAYARGPEWRRLLRHALTLAAQRPRDRTLKIVERTRGELPKFDVQFGNSPARYDLVRDAVLFEGRESFGGRVACVMSREALDDRFGAGGLDENGRLECFRRNRSAIEEIARWKYLNGPVDAPGSVLVKTEDVIRLPRKP